MIPNEGRSWTYTGWTKLHRGNRRPCNHNMHNLTGSMPLACGRNIPVTLGTSCVHRVVTVLCSREGRSMTCWTKWLIGSWFCHCPHCFNQFSRTCNTILHGMCNGQSDQIFFFLVPRAWELSVGSGRRLGSRSPAVCFFHPFTPLVDFTELLYLLVEEWSKWANPGHRNKIPGWTFPLWNAQPFDKLNINVAYLAFCVCDFWTCFFLLFRQTLFSFVDLVIFQ